jgi:integrase/recombinase XerD
VRAGAQDAAVRVIKQRDGGIVRRVELVDGDGEPVGSACRFLNHLADRGFSPHTLCAYAYDLKYLFTFLHREDLDWRGFRAPDALRLLGFLRQTPTRRPAQRLGLAVVVGGADTPGKLLAASTVNRILAAVASFYDGPVASVKSKIRQAWSMRRRSRRVPALRSGFAGFRFRVSRTLKGA